MKNIYSEMLENELVKAMLTEKQIFDIKVLEMAEYKKEMYIDYIEVSDTYGVFDCESGVCVFESVDQNKCDNYLEEIEV